MPAAPSRPPERALLYHFTHVNNLASIFSSGRLVADRATCDVELAADVGDAEVKARRRGRRVPDGSGATIADFTPFYFAPRSPMMFRIACDHRDAVPGRYADGDDPLVYLVTSVDRIVGAGLRWLATDGNAAAAITEFTDEVGDLWRLVDWPLMEEKIWKDTDEDRDRQRRRMAEFLVHGEMPTNLLVGCGVRTDERHDQVRSLLSGGPLQDLFIGVRPEWYYGYGRQRGGQQ